METNILLSKIVATPGESTWSQAYSTLNLYIVLSIKSQDVKEGIVGQGKELFEKIQREYFSLDDKNLKNIKEAVEKALAETEDKNNVSVVLATITNNIMYIVVASEGYAILKRSGKVAPIAKGEAGEVLAFSGELSHNDIVILETADFNNKVPVEKLSGVLDNLEVSEISEQLAPLIHNDPVGTEAAIVIQYKNAENTEKQIEETGETDETEGKSKDEEIVPETEPTHASSAKMSLPKFKLPGLPTFGKKRVILAAIVILVVILICSVIIERNHQTSVKRQAQLAEILDPARKKFDEANTLASLNRGLALDEFNTLKTDLDGSQDKIPQGTAERKKLDEFIGQVESKIGELGAGSTLANQKMIYDKNPALVTLKDNQLAVVTSDGKISLLDSSGQSKKDIDSKNKDITSIGEDSGSVYIAGDDGIVKADLKSGKASVAEKDASDTISLDNFGSNLYGLNSKTKTVDKYPGGTGTRADYFKGSITLSDPSSMAIDGSIWILDGGKVRKFTKGTEDTFTVTGLTKNISNNALIFTNVDYANIYVLDTNTTRIIEISKDGSVKNQYVSKDLSSAASFAVDESAKKIYVVISSKLYSFDL